MSSLPGEPSVPPTITPPPSSSSSSEPPPPSSSSSTPDDPPPSSSSSESSSNQSSSQSSSSSSGEVTSESTFTESSTSVYESASVITSDGETLTTFVQYTTVISPGAIVTQTGTPESNSTPTGAIVGGVVGGIAGLVIIGAIIFFLFRRKRNKFDKEFDGNFDPDYVAAAASSSVNKKPTAVLTHKRKSTSLDGNTSSNGNMRQRVNLDDANSYSAVGKTGGQPQSQLEAALAEDDGMGGRLDASTVGGGILTPFPYSKTSNPNFSQPYQNYNNATSVPVGGVYGQSPYSPPMSTASPPPMSVSGHSMSGHGHDGMSGVGLGLGAAAAAGYYGAQGQGQQGYYGGGGSQQGYGSNPISPASTDGTGSAGQVPWNAPTGGAANPYLQPQGGGPASGTNRYPSLGAAAAVGVPSATTASQYSRSDGGQPHGGSQGSSQPLQGMSAKEREALGYRGPHVVNPDEGGNSGGQAGRSGSDGSGPLPSPYDNNGAGGSSSQGVVQHQDGGRVPQRREDEEPPSEIPPAYDSLRFDADGARR